MDPWNSMDHMLHNFYESGANVNEQAAHSERTSHELLCTCWAYDRERERKGIREGQYFKVLYVLYL